MQFYSCKKAKEDTKLSHEFAAVKEDMLYKKEFTAVKDICLRGFCSSHGRYAYNYNKGFI
jgi:hypothetical protein